MNQTVKEYSQKYMRKAIPFFEVGDTVDVVLKILEGDKERKQTFNGTVIAKSGTGINERFIVRRIVQGEGVERIFPIHSSRISTIKVKRKGRIRRAKLYYLRDRVGKATKVKERIWTAEEARASAKQSKKMEKESEKKDKK